MAKAAKSLKTLVNSALLKKSEIELNEEQLNLLRLCRLLVDIQKRIKSEGHSYEGQKPATEN